jgi:hypothetical protein
MSNVIRLQFVRDGVPQGAEYTYYTPEGLALAVGDEVAIDIKRGVVTAVDVPVEEIQKFGDRARTIMGKMPYPEDKDVPFTGK